MKNKIIKNDKLIDIILIASFIIFTLPRSIDAIPIVHKIVNVLKVMAGLFAIINFLFSKKKLNNFLVLLGFYSFYIVVITFINKHNIFTPIKAYGLNVVSIILLNLIIDRESSKKIFKILGMYFLALITISFVQIGVIFLTTKLLSISQGDIVTILGQDNRLVLYIFLDILIFAYNKDVKMVKYTALFGLIATLLAWSVMGFVSIIVMLLGYVLLYRSKGSLNIETLLLLFVLLSLGLVCFDIHELFSVIIVKVLHKSLTLSYRTLIWRAAVNDLLIHPINLGFGFGFFETTDYLRSIYINAPVASTPIHLHNLPLNTIFFSGIFGFLIYMINLFLLGKEIVKIRNIRIKSLFSAIFGGILLLLIMDTFEYYQIYYLCLGLLNYYYIYSNKHFLRKKA